MSVIGPVEILAIEVEEPDVIAPAIAAAVDAGLIRIIDMLLVRREADGTVTSTEVSQADGDAASAWADLEGEVHGLVNDDDLAAIGAALNPGAAAALVVYEHVWARPLADALQEAGGRIALRHHIPAADAQVALAALEGAS
ncbi:DUF6325 family protein [Baekduia sp. Peel2402]|uniref:DUF6325 family protein n=1 Tax=Baekduia sp. Peel2402 TaxID=3458296 RepID=UPI00403E48E2